MSYYRGNWDLTYKNHKALKIVEIVIHYLSIPWFSPGLVFGTPGRKEGGRCATGGKKGGKKKLRKVAGTEIKGGCGWREVFIPHPPSLSVP